MTTADHAPQESKPRKRATKPADDTTLSPEAMQNVLARQRRTRQLGDHLRISLSPEVSAEIAATKEEFFAAGQSAAFVDQAVDDAIQVALHKNVKALAVAKLKASLAGFLGERGASWAEGG
jgi:hypothetical protein